MIQCTALVALGTAASGALPQLPVAALAHATAASNVPRNTLLVIGDSLSAEYGLKRGSGWVALLDQRLVGERIAARVVNASISGDTTAGGLSRLPELLARHRPTQVLIELGGNDALRGMPLASTQRNLVQMTQSAKAAGARVVIIGIQIPPNYGRRYNDELAEVFVNVAKTEGAALVPFLLKDVTDAQYQADRIHPIEAGHPTMLANVWPTLKPLLR